MVLPLRAMLARLAFALPLLLLAACETDGVAPGRNPQIPAASSSSAMLRPGDTLTVALQGVPDPSINQVLIDDQGLISLPFIGTLTASGATPGELGQRIRETYVAKKIYNVVDVSVSVTERFVYVGGEVAHPGRIAWTPDLTVAKAVQAAGGFTLYAKETDVSLVRDAKAYSINVKVAQKKPEQDAHLMPGDSIQVSRSAF